MRFRHAIAATTLAALAAPAAAGAHATVTPMQPQGSALTAARTLYVLRVPNERPDTDTFRVTLRVPRAVQGAISLAKKPGWDVKLGAATRASAVRPATPSGRSPGSRGRRVAAPRSSRPSSTTS